MKLSVKEACIKLEKTERTIYKWLKAGKLKGEKIEGKWLVVIHDTEKEKEKEKEKSTVEKKVLEKLEELAQKVSDMEKENELLKEKIKKIDENLAEEKEQKKRLLEILSRVVKSQLQLKQKSENCEVSVKKVVDEVELLRQVQKSLQRVEKPVTKEMASDFDDSVSYNCSNKSNGGKTAIKNEEKAEKWVRNNIDDWFYKNCGFGQIGKYSWEDIALNKAPKVKVKGKDQPSRSYLHILAKTGNTWGKIKAAVALEITADQKDMYSKAYNHYMHPNEIGG